MSGDIQNNGFKNFRQHGANVDINKSHWGTDENGKKVFLAKDSDGKLLRVMHDANNDGFFETEDNIDENGHVSEQLMDTDGDMKMDLYVEYQYEDDRESARSIDYDLDGITDVTSYLDEDGNIVADEIDTDSDGTADLYVDYEYDANGNEVRRSLDIDGDGKTDVVSTLDENGTIVADDIDTDGDGKTDLHVEYVYDENGNEAQRIIDNDGDGLPDTISKVDENGRITSEEIDTDGDGILDTHVEYTYDTSGNISVSKEQQLILAPSEITIPDSCKVEGTTIYGPTGVQIGVVITVNENGQEIQKIYSFGEEVEKPDAVTYENGKYTTTNSKGRVVAEDIDTNNDGMPDTHIEYSYKNGQKSIARKTTLKLTPEGTTISSICTVRGNRIFNAEGQQIGFIVTTIENGKEVQRIYAIGQEID